MTVGLSIAAPCADALVVHSTVLATWYLDNLQKENFSKETSQQL